MFLSFIHFWKVFLGVVLCLLLPVLSFFPSLTFCPSFFSLLLSLPFLLSFPSFSSLKMLLHCLADPVSNMTSAVSASLYITHLFPNCFIFAFSSSLILKLLIMKCLGSVGLWNSYISEFMVFLKFWKLSDIMSKQTIEQNQTKFKFLLSF